jgi:hypothetical protein
MASELRTKFIALKQAFTMTLAALPNNTGRQSDMLANPNGYPAALIFLRLRSGTAPTVNTLYEVYLLRGDDAGLGATYRTDGAGPTDAAITIENATLLGTIVVTATANKFFYAEFDTAPLGPLGPEWGIAIKNTTGQALHATEADHIKEYAYYVPEAQ